MAHVLWQAISEDFPWPCPRGRLYNDIQNGDFQIELFEYENPKQLPPDRLTPNSDLQTVGTKHIAFATDNMAALKEKFAENGVDIAHEVIMEGNNVMFIRDCNGVLIEFIQNN